MTKWTTLGEFVQSHDGFIQTGPFGSQLHAAEYVPSGVPVIMPTNISDGRIKHDSNLAKISKEKAATLAKHLCSPGDILYSRRGDITQRALVQANDGIVFCGTGCLRINLGSAPKVWAQYVSYQLGLPETHQWLLQHAVGATMLNLNTRILSAIPLKFPSFQPAQRIVSILESLDDKIEANTKLAATADALASALYREAISLHSASNTPLGEILTLEYGKSLPARARTKGPIPVYGSGGITGTHSVPLLSGPSIIIGRKGTVGALYWETGPSYPIDTTFWVKPKDPNHSLHFLFETLRSVPFREMNNDSAVPGLNRSEALALVVPLLPRKYVQKLTEKLSSLRAQIDSLATESQSLVEIRDYLLPRLMNGQVKLAISNDAASLSSTSN